MPNGPAQPHRRPKAVPGAVPADGRRSPEDRRAKTPLLSGQEAGRAPSKPPAQGLLRLPAMPQLSWFQWGLVGLLVTSTMGVASVILLLQMPALPDCLTARWPLASGGQKLYCAGALARQDTLDALKQAIALADSLPKDHPLRNEAERSINNWSRQVLKLADDLYQSGELDQAIEATTMIPRSSQAYGQVGVAVARWQSEWRRAEGIYQEAQSSLRQQQWREAALSANRLLGVDNEYWRVTRFDALRAEIDLERQASVALDAAEAKASSGRLDDLLAAIELARKVPMERYARSRAQSQISLWTRAILDIAQARLDKRDLDGALAAASKVPADSSLREEAADFMVLARAYEPTWSDTAEGLREAIAQVRKMATDRPLFYKAQDLATRWQDEIADLEILDKARETARPGTVTALQSAIAQAGNLSAARPRWEQAQNLMRGWQQRIEKIEDSPYLDQARTIARQGTVEAYYAAMSTAAQIPPGRALYDEAQKQIEAWRDQIETIQDQPFLDRAEQYADQGNLREAIAEASRISSDRSLHRQARRRVRVWQAELDGFADLQQAIEVSAPGTADALSQAIQLASPLTNSGTYGSQAKSQIDVWSARLLAIARSQANYDLPLAVATAQKIPANSDVYTEAQDQLRRWQQGSQ
ncbi:chromosome segregation ATPase [Leptolyngbya sp. FACHB-261]|uniref:chromosome segregation ATPase n=1 Tax=Leptolyngbya sp. FACHB-261 TaxID=2692806 RepID=UPI00168611AC|nr:chromosome segregation ATPase [Leptolyngbya sp. FACHB-261]